MSHRFTLQKIINFSTIFLLNFRLDLYFAFHYFNCSISVSFSLSLARMYYAISNRNNHLFHWQLAISHIGFGRPNPTQKDPDYINTVNLAIRRCQRGVRTQLLRADTHFVSRCYLSTVYSQPVQATTGSGIVITFIPQRGW